MQIDYFVFDLHGSSRERSATLLAMKHSHKVRRDVLARIKVDLDRFDARH
jgi:hypothetical protein